jgi:hypothetical protein
MFNNTKEIKKEEYLLKRNIVMYHLNAHCLLLKMVEQNDILPSFFPPENNRKYSSLLSKMVEAKWQFIILLSIR